MKIKQPKAGLYKIGNGTKKGLFVNQRSPKKQEGEHSIIVTKEVFSDEDKDFSHLKVITHFVVGIKLVKGAEIRLFKMKKDAAKFLGISNASFTYSKKQGNKVKGYELLDDTINIKELSIEKNERRCKKVYEPSLIAVDIRTNKRLYFVSMAEAKRSGFNAPRIYEALGDRSQTDIVHKGYIWMYGD